jgi:hypothetical protein
MMKGGHVVDEKPRHIMIRDTVNHRAHHGGPLTVYLRLNDALVPAVYGSRRMREASSCILLTWLRAMS